MTKAVRGAVSVDRNDNDAMEKAVTQLLSAVVKANNISIDKIISIIFSQTDDLNVANPAAALRVSGIYSSIPLFCTKEPDYEISLPLMLRVLLTFDAESNSSVTPVYLGQAALLRKDLNSNGKK